MQSSKVLKSQGALNVTGNLDVAGTSALVGDVTVTGDVAVTGAITGTGMLSVYVPDAVFETIAAGNPGALSVATTLTNVSTDAGGDAFTLADGTVVGQLKIIFLLVDGTGACLITPANFADGTSLTFDDAGDFCHMIWNGTNWRLILNNGGTIA